MNQTSYPKTKKPIVTDFSLTSNSKYRIFVWGCPLCDQSSGAQARLGSTGKSVECSSCGASFWLTLEWVHSSPTKAKPDDGIRIEELPNCPGTYRFFQSSTPKAKGVD